MAHGLRDNSMEWNIILLAIAVSVIKLGQSFAIDINHLYYKKANPWLVLRSVITVIFLVPALYLLLILLFRPQLNILLAIIIMAVAPAADLSVQQVEALGGNVGLAGLVQMICCLISLITSPLLLQGFEKLLGLYLDLSWPELTRDILLAQFLPMLIGIILTHYFPILHKKASLITKSAKWLLLFCFAVLLIKHYEYFFAFSWETYFSVIIATVSAFILGIIMAGRKAEDQISLAIESGLRNPGLAYLIASENFLKHRATIAMLPYVVVTGVTIIVATHMLKLMHRYCRSNHR